MFEEEISIIIIPSADCRAVQEFRIVLEVDAYRHISLYSAYVIAEG